MLNEWSSKNLWKMISPDVKANIKQEIKDLVAESYKFFLDVHFSFWFWLVFLYYQAHLYRLFFISMTAFGHNKIGTQKK